jgi:very-short-patch-repair endonuclease
MLLRRAAFFTRRFPPGLSPVGASPGSGPRRSGHGSGMDMDLSSAPRLVRTRSLRQEGWGERRTRHAVASGEIVRLRDGAFCSPTVHPDCRAAGALRGRLTCVSELRRRGIFVQDRTALHVHIDRSASRLPRRGRDVHVHRDTLRRTPHPDELCVGVFDALLHAVRCQPPRLALASLDSALHCGAVDEDDVDLLFQLLPRRYRRLRGLVDRRAESGPETLMRLMLRTLGCRFEVQVKLVGVGRVDFVVEGWLIVECDSVQFHGSPEDQRRDRRRDQAAATLGYATYRPLAEDIMWRPEAVVAALRGLLSLRPVGKAC